MVKYSHVNKCVDVEHGRNHMTTNQSGIPLTSEREITNDDNDSQGIVVHSNECE